MGWLVQKSWSDRPAPYRVLIALFDGLFVFHYFVEALIWKFGNPFYRAVLGPLYFGPAAPRPPAPEPSPAAGWPAGAPARERAARGRVAPVKRVKSS
jgi:hypothetical protein